jgi:hypothetical protein
VKKEGKTGKRGKIFLASLFYFPFLILFAASLLAFFGCLLAGVIVILSALFLAFIFRIALKDKSPWKARSRATDCAILIFCAFVFLGSYLLLRL